MPNTTKAHACRAEPPNVIKPRLHASSNARSHWRSQTALASARALRFEAVHERIDLSPEWRPRIGRRGSRGSRTFEDLRRPAVEQDGKRAALLAFFARSVERIDRLVSVHDQHRRRRIAQKLRVCFKQGQTERFFPGRNRAGRRTLAARDTEHARHRVQHREAEGRRRNRLFLAEGEKNVGRAPQFTVPRGENETNALSCAWSAGSRMQSCATFSAARERLLSLRRTIGSMKPISAAPATAADQRMTGMVQRKACMAQ